MKISLFKYGILIISSISVLMSSSCKKGEEDPAITLLSRKARLAGDWKLKSGELHLTKKLANGNSTEYNYNFDPGHYILDSSRSSSSLKGKFDLSISFTRKGIMNLNQTMDNENFTSEGTWDFAGKIGKYKNKEFISLQLKDMVGYSNRLDFFNKSVIQFNYRIKELRNKEIILVNDDELISTDFNGVEYRVNARYTLIQK